MVEVVVVEGRGEDMDFLRDGEVSSILGGPWRVMGGWLAGGGSTLRSFSMPSRRATRSVREHMYAREIGLDVSVGGICAIGKRLPVDLPPPLVVVLDDAFYA